MNDYKRLTPGWFDEQMKDIRKEIQSWPPWMRGGWHPETKQVATELHQQLSERDATIAALRSALEPFAKFVGAFDAKPIRGLNPEEIYGIHGGDAVEGGASLRWPDLRNAAAVLAAPNPGADLRARLAEAERERDALESLRKDLIAALNCSGDFLVRAVKEMSEERDALKAQVADERQMIARECESVGFKDSGYSAYGWACVLVAELRKVRAQVAELRGQIGAIAEACSMDELRWADIDAAKERKP